MNTLQTLKTFIHQKLAGAVDEILGLVETTVQNYEEEIQRQKRIIELERAQSMVHNNNTDCPQAVRFRVIVGEDIRKITFKNGLPFCVNDFAEVLRQAFSLDDHIRLYYKDSDFDDFFTLTSTQDLRDKDTLKVVQLSRTHERTSTTPTQNLTPTISEIHSLSEIPALEMPDFSSVGETQQLNSGEHLDMNLDFASVASEDAVPSNLPTSTEPQNRPNGGSSTFRKLWPAVFEIPTFSLTTELILQQASERFRKDGTLISPEQLKSVKSDILQRLVERMYMYTAYPQNQQRDIVCQELIKQHPYLRDRGSLSGFKEWSVSLKYKFGNYRSKLRNTGTQELLVNSLKQNRGRFPSQAKKPRKSEVNFLPPFPEGETEQSLEELRRRLVELNQSRDWAQVQELMERTYSYRRQEVVVRELTVVEVQERWPALFSPVQINEEFRRCTTVPLQSSFMSNLDKYIPKLLTLFSSVGGALGERLKSQWLELVQDTAASVVKRRDVVLRCLIEYIGDSVTDLVSDFSGVSSSSSSSSSLSEQEVVEELRSEQMKVFVLPDAVGVVLDGAVVLRGLPSLSSACCLLFGLLYALNKDFPPHLFKTLELFQKLLVGLDSMQSQPSVKLFKLKHKLMDMD
ncbi:sterile alpha motif domain-containing protein 3-like [Boleophthalmus pectinirostris]|uniref:sterile alpha motif domain-containing protein 3-like n=1 Tax=Boleophthalmus pectinirostris TaxID=150288 RepID=UPI00242E1E8B|nr:sterile alpha motif domain-containing protein 3-like [Boleophthalmus pectinirostris]